MVCPKCASECAIEILPSKREDMFRVKYECTKVDCHLRSWMMADTGEKIEESKNEMKFSKTRSLCCEICHKYTDILHPFKIEGDEDYLMCGECMESFSEAERLSGILLKGSSFLP